MGGGCGRGGVNTHVCQIIITSEVKYSASKHQQVLLLCNSHALEIIIIRLRCNYLIAKWSAPNSLYCCIINNSRIKSSLILRYVFYDFCKFDCT